MRAHDFCTDFCRGSGGTQHSASSGGLYDTSSSSARYSSSSTLPSTSSVENFTDDLPHAHPKVSKPLPLLPPPVADPAYTPSSVGSGDFIAQKAPEIDIQNPTDTITTPQPSTMYADIPDIGRKMRPRAMTETSGSTATPPKLLDAELGFGRSDEFDNFGNMFEGINSGSGQSSPLSRNLHVAESVCSAGNDVQNITDVCEASTWPIQLDTSCEAAIGYTSALYTAAASHLGSESTTHCITLFQR